MNAFKTQFLDRLDRDVLVQKECKACGRMDVCKDGLCHACGRHAAEWQRIGLEQPRDHYASKEV